MTQVLASGVITIMFTDLVGSTALSDGLGDEAARALLRAHDRILREQLERFDGKVVKGHRRRFADELSGPATRPSFTWVCLRQSALYPPTNVGHLFRLA